MNRREQPRPHGLERRARVPRWLAAALLLAAPAVSTPVQSGVQELLRTFDARQPGAEESTARALAALGPALMPELFAALAPQGDRPVDALIGETFRRLPQPEVQAFLERLPELASGPERRRAALCLLQQAGLAGTLATCFPLAGLPNEIDLPEELVRALLGILARDERAFDRALTLGVLLPESAAEPLARALAESRTQAGARVLLLWGRRANTLAQHALANLCAVAAELPPPLAPELLALERELLAERDHPSAQELLLIAGRFEDDDALPLLIERLECAQAGQQANARWSLRRITGLDLGGDPRVWDAWFQAEQDWWNDSSIALLQELHEGDSAGKQRALQQLGQRHWRHLRLGEELVRFLPDASPAEAAVACTLLGQFRCRPAAEALRARLAAGDEGLRQAAASALASLERKPLPPRRLGLSAGGRARPQR